MGKYKILFLDDDSNVSKAAELFLNPIASKLTFVSNGIDCLEVLLSDQDYDIIILDFMLPDIDGLNILEQIRNRNTIKLIPVIIQTGVSSIEVDKVEKLGATILHKPYTKQELYKKIYSLLLIS